VIRKVGRWFNPVTLLLAAACFALPFLSVSCDTPGGYAGAGPGGSSTYNGVALVVGGAPEVTEGHQRAVPSGENDRLPPQPALAAALVAILAAAVLTVTTAHTRSRRAAVATIAAAGATAVVVGEALAQDELTVRVADHLTRLAQAGERIDPAKTGHDYVHAGPGFVFCLALLVVVVVANGIGWWRLRTRPALVATPARDPWAAGQATIPQTTRASPEPHQPASGADA
jgi:hypothetical protein